MNIITTFVYFPEQTRELRAVVKVRNIHPEIINRMIDRVLKKESLRISQMTLEHKLSWLLSNGELFPDLKKALESVP